MTQPIPTITDVLIRTSTANCQHSWPVEGGSISSDDLAKQLADAERLIPPTPPGPRPGQACLYKGGEVFYVDPAFGDRLESWEYGVMPEFVDSGRPMLSKHFEGAQIRRTSPFRFDAC